ncbi:MAG: hypothetical protein ACM3OB_05425, partial [Acidobacteriota bacterium]
SAKLQGALPRALGVMDSVTGAIASGMDALPVWTLLVARLAAEASILPRGGAALSGSSSAGKTDPEIARVEVLPVDLASLLGSG